MKRTSENPLASPMRLTFPVGRSQRRWWLPLVLVALLGATLLGTGREALYAQASSSTADTAKAIQKLEEELGKLEKSLAEKQKALSDNESAQAAARRAGDTERIRILKRDQVILGEEANKIQADITAKDVEIEAKYAALRTAAQSEMEKLLADAVTAVAAGNAGSAADALKSASDAHTEWKRGVDRWKPYAHTEEALIKPALEENRKRAESEQRALENGLSRLKAERDLEEKELKSADAMIARNIAHADWAPLQTKLKEMRKKIGANKTDIDRRIKALEGRAKAIAEYLKG